MKFVNLALFELLEQKPESTAGGERVDWNIDLAEIGKELKDIKTEVEGAVYNLESLRWVRRPVLLNSKNMKRFNITPLIQFNRWHYQDADRLPQELDSVVVVSKLDQRIKNGIIPQQTVGVWTANPSPIPGTAWQQFFDKVTNKTTPKNPFKDLDVNKTRFVPEDYLTQLGMK